MYDKARFLFPNFPGSPEETGFELANYATVELREKLIKILARRIGVRNGFRFTALSILFVNAKTEDIRLQYWMALKNSIYIIGNYGVNNGK